MEHPKILRNGKPASELHTGSCSHSMDSMAIEELRARGRGLSSCGAARPSKGWEFNLEQSKMTQQIRTHQSVLAQELLDINNRSPK